MPRCRLKLRCELPAILSINFFDCSDIAAGIYVIASTKENAIEAMTASAISEKSLPKSPGKKKNGTKAAIVVTAEPEEERDVSAAPSTIDSAAEESGCRFSFSNTFSIATAAGSITMPMPIVMPDTDKMLTVLPHSARANTEKSIESGITLAAKSDIRNVRKNKNSTIAVITAPSAADTHRFRIDAVSSSDRSNTILNVKFPPYELCSRSISLVNFFDTASGLASAFL